MKQQSTSLMNNSFGLSGSDYMNMKLTLPLPPVTG